MSKQPNWFIFVTLLSALLITIFTLPNWLTWLRPNFVLLVLIYWVLALDLKISVGFAWIMGLLLDLLGNTLLGEHALALVITIYITVKFQPQIRMSPIAHQAAIIFVLSICYLITLYWVEATIGQAPKTRLFWLAAISNALLWPWLVAGLHYIRHKLEIRN